MICKEIADQYGANSKYTKDCQIRTVRGLPYRAASAALEWTAPPPIVIQAGIGTLVLGPDSEEFTPAPTLTQMARGAVGALADLTLAPAEEASRRLAICEMCPLWRKESGTCGACGCVTQAKARLSASVCPKGMWNAV